MPTETRTDVRPLILVADDEPGIRESFEEGARETIRIAVTDTGVGIPPDLLPHIFDPFFTTKEKGTGLGMAIAHRIIEDHLGSIEVSSRVGEGTTFTITLPIQTTGAEAPAAARTRSPSTPASTP